MFRIVEQADGSTAIYDRCSGKLLSLTYSDTSSKNKGNSSSGADLTTLTQKNRKFDDFIDVIELSSSDGGGSGSERGAPSSKSGRNQQVAFLGSATSSARTTAPTTSGTGPTNPVAGASELPSTMQQKNRTLRPRVTTEYNEDRTFENLMKAKPPTSSTSSQPQQQSKGPTNSSSTANGKPDHLVVVFKHTKDKEAASPNRMRLLPAATFSKLRQECSVKNSSWLESRPPEEPESDCIDQDTYSKYLNLIPKREMKKASSMGELNRTWPLRHQSRTSLWKKMITARKEAKKLNLVDELDSPATSRTSSNRSTPEPGSSNLIQTASKPRVTPAQWIHELKSRQPSNLNNREPQLVIRELNGMLLLKPAAMVPGHSQALAPFGMSSLRETPPPQVQKDVAMIAKRFGRFVTKFATKIELTSNLGRFLIDLHPYVLLSVDKKRVVIRSHHERHTHGSFQQSWIESRPSYDFSFTSFVSEGATMTLRAKRSMNNIDAKTVSMVSNALGFYHTYTFSTQERLEKFLTLDTGLDWRGRLLSFHCEPLSVTVHDIKRCISCHSKLCPRKGHSCVKEADKEQVEPRRSSVNRSPPPSSNEVNGQNGGGRIAASNGLKRRSLEESNSTSEPFKRLRGTARKSFADDAQTMSTVTAFDVSTNENKSPLQEPLSPKTCCISCGNFDCHGRCQGTPVTQKTPTLRSVHVLHPASVTPVTSPVRRSQAKRNQDCLSQPTPTSSSSVQQFSSQPLPTQSRSPAVALINSGQAAKRLRTPVTASSNKYTATLYEGPPLTRQSFRGDGDGGLRRTSGLTRSATYNIRTPVSAASPMLDKNSCGSDEEVILIGSSPTPAPSPVRASGHRGGDHGCNSNLARMQHNSLNSNRSGVQMDGKIALAGPHAALLNLSLLRQKFNEKLVTTNQSQRLSGGAVFDQKSKIVIEGLDA